MLYQQCQFKLSIEMVRFKPKFLTQVECLNLEVVFVSADDEDNESDEPRIGVEIAGEYEDEASSSDALPPMEKA